jgi:C-3',4' desaturase CrtD
MKDVAVIGGGIAGMATAARLQARGFSTIVFEAHSSPGGCAGYFRRKGFAFDVGATTLVDFEADGVGGEFLSSIGMKAIDGEALPGYIAWLPDRTVTLYRDPEHWSAERLRAFRDTPPYREFWAFLDRLAAVFWNASRRGVKLPLQSLSDILYGARTLGLSNLALARYTRWTMGDALRAFDLREDQALVGLLAMLIEDTVHSTIDTAPLINAALGITIRGAGLSRHRGGMAGFWHRLVTRYRVLGGELRTRCKVERIEGRHGDFSIHTQRGTFYAAQVVSALPAQITGPIAPSAVAHALRPYIERDENALGGAMVVFLGVPESEVAAHEFTHHQLMQDYNQPLGYGNNMFVSVSATDDTASAPAGYRAVMISTHCELDAWENLSPEEYEAHKQSAGDCLVDYARRVYPNLGERAVVYEVATPRTYERYTSRPRGAVGGVRQTLSNANQNAIPHDVGVKGFWLVGDTTWPGLGTVACVLGSRIVADGVAYEAERIVGARRAVPLREAI